MSHSSLAYCSQCKRMTEHKTGKSHIKHPFFGERATLECYIPISKSKCIVCGGKKPTKLSRRFKTKPRRKC